MGGVGGWGTRGGVVCRAVGGRARRNEVLPEAVRRRDAVATDADGRARFLSAVAANRPRAERSTNSTVCYTADAMDPKIPHPSSTPPKASPRVSKERVKRLAKSKGLDVTFSKRADLSSLVVKHERRKKVIADPARKERIQSNIQRGQEALARAAEVLVKSGVSIDRKKDVPYFFAEGGKIVRVLNDERVRGRIVDGSFVADESET